MTAFNFKVIYQLEKWAKTWQMDLNPSKCEFLKITNKKLALHFSYHINNEIIKEVQHVKYLGIIIDSHMTWREHVKVLSHKANTTLAFLQHNLKPYSSYIKAKSVFICQAYHRILIYCLRTLYQRRHS